MAVYKIFPTKDTTLYSAYPSMNTGLDEILEASTNFIEGPLKLVGDTPQTSRTLIQFNSDDISYVSQSLIKNKDWKVYLKLFVANTTGIQTDTKILVNALSQSWDMGTGFYSSYPEVQNGASWTWSNYSGSTSWKTSNFANNSTASFEVSNPGGGVWWVTPSASQTFSYRSNLDLNFNVTDIVKYWTGSVWNNNGFILRQDPSQEFINNINKQTTLKYFSIDTHTIYPPQLEFRWNDFIWNTGSSTQTVINDSDVYISLANNPGFFYPESIQRFRLNVRPQYPTRTFQTSSIYTTNYYLPSGSSYYAVKDLHTNEMVIDFDEKYTLISSDEESSFFDIYMNGLEPERYYCILMQTTIGDTTLILDNNYNFKIING
jgi:hypothetical protein